MRRPIRGSRLGLIAGAIALPMAIVVLLGTLGNGVTAGTTTGLSADLPFDRHLRPAEPADPGASAAAQDAFVFRFDPVLENFETFTIPTSGANPHSIAVSSNASSVDVWFTEPAADQIGRLVYTATNDFIFTEYQVAPGSRPLNLVVEEDGRVVWFTEQASNRIGRLDIGNGGAFTYTTFDVDTPNSQPAGIDLAPDGSVWFTEMAADKIGRLVVTSPPSHTFTEYTVSGTGTDVGLYGIAVQSDEYIWVGETRTGVVRQLNATNGSFLRLTGNDLGTDSYPYSLVVDHARPLAWLTEREDNQISQIDFRGTLFLVNSYDITSTRNVRPTGLTMLGSDQFWFAAQGSGQVGRMVLASPVEFKVFDLPYGGLWAMDITLDDSDKLWTVAFLPRRVFLPLTTKTQ